MSNTNKVWIICAVHGDADEYEDIAYHRTEAGAQAKMKDLDPEKYAKDEFGYMAPRFQVISKPLEP